MTGLLVSVRNLEEAEIASRFPIDILDLKDPTRGALGPVEGAIQRQIIAALPPTIVKSIALGELRDAEPDTENLAPFQFAKIGLAGMALVPNWQQHWLNLQAKIPSGVRLVVVAYADHAKCQAPSIDDVLEFAKSASAGILLVDTFNKSSGNLLDCLGFAEIQRLIETSHQQDIKIVIAGSIGSEHVPRLLPLKPDFIGIRGAACQAGREHLNAQQLEGFCQAWQRSVRLLPRLI